MEDEREIKAKLHRDELLSRMKWLFHCDEIPFECVVGKDNDIIVIFEEDVVARIFFRELSKDVIANLGYALYRCYRVLRHPSICMKEDEDNK